MTDEPTSAADVATHPDDGPSGAEGESGGPTIEYLIFVTQGRDFAVPITSVREIREWSEPTPLPHAPQYLLGVINLRGTVLPVIDLANRLGMAPTAKADRNVFVVIEVAGRPHGLLVEAVADIHGASEEAHQPLPPGNGGEGAGCISGLILASDRMIQVLDAEAVSALLPVTEPRAA